MSIEKRIMDGLNKTKLHQLDYEDLCLIGESIIENIGPNPTNKELKEEILRQEKIHL